VKQEAKPEDKTPPWRVKREDKDGDEDETPPWKPLAAKVEPEFVVISDSDEDDAPPDSEAARRLLAAARRTHQTMELGEQPADDPRASVPGLARWEGGDDPTGRLVRLRNYAAVDAEAGGYGLIDRGTREAGVRSLVMHTPSRRKLTRGQPSPPMVRPGTILTVRSPLRGTTARLRVRYTTPARYYSPGQRVTTLGVGVDARDWQAFVGREA
jgi:hypothetical protein